ncbi:MAG TPA: aminoacetone oxidase family FAD-binding enzyme [Longimicrobiales bacterium]
MARPEVVVIGAGAAGLVAAIFAARRGAEVLVVESTAEGGKKILISGGGRCNVLPSQLAAERFVTDSAPHLMRGLLRSWPLAQQRAFFERDLDVPLALEEETGKLFPVSNRARDVRDALQSRARQAGVQFHFGRSISKVEQVNGDWRLHNTAGMLEAGRVIVATGGLSVPATGSDGTGLRFVEALGHRLTPLYPALTPLIANPARHQSLSGISLSVRLRARATSESKIVETTGGFLFTHRGYSGPSVLDISHVATRNPGAVIRTQWSPLTSVGWADALLPRNALVNTAMSAHVPQRLALQLMHECGVPAERRLNELRRAERVALIAALTAYVLPWTSDEGFKKAEVTGGGVALEEVHPGTLESRRCRGLFLCGEMLDAFGPIGGHNFAWAWATGRLAGIGASQSRHEEV